MKTLSAAFSFLFTLLIALPVLAATPQIRVNSDQSPVKLVSVVVHTDIAGSMAETTVEMKFRNDSNRTLEGELLFPLAPGQNIIGFSLDINGQQREAVAVDKARGRAAMDNIVRRGVDPGLIEKTAGNNFRLRVYPLFAKQTRTVVMRYSEALTKQNQYWRYRFPLDYENKLENFALTATVKHRNPPVIQGNNQVKMEKVGDLYRAVLDQKNYQPTGWLDVLVPIEDQPSLYTEKVGNDTYFYAEVPIRKYTPTDRPPVSEVTILWDSSASMADSLKTNLALLDRYFAYMKNVQVNLIRLYQQAEAPVQFSVRNGNWMALKNELTATVYDGATNLSDWTFNNKRQDYLLFTDGLNNWTKNPLVQKPANTPAQLYIISAAAKIDANWLRYHAERNNGRFIDLKRDKINLAANQLLKQDARLIVIDRKNAAHDIVVESRYPVDGRFRLSGILNNNAQDLMFEVAYPHNKMVQSAVLSTRKPTQQNGIARYWGQMSINALEGDPARNKNKITDISQCFNLVTSTTSLIVLEQLWDYAQNKIALPESMASYQSQYDSYVKRFDEQEKQRIKNHMPNMIARFEQRIKWWETDFPKGPKPEPKAQTKPDPRERRVLEGRSIAQTEVVAEPVARPSAMMTPIADMAVEEGASFSRMGTMDAMKMADGASQNANKPRSDISVSVTSWSPDAAYLEDMVGKSPSDIYQVYLKERSNYASSPGFYLDVAKILMAANADRNLTIRVLSNLVEMEMDNRHILRVLAYRLMEMNEAREAIPFLETVVEMAPDEPQSFRDLGLAYHAAGDDQKAIDSLYEVVSQPWDHRFGDIGLISLAELNAIVATAQRPLRTITFEPKLMRNLPLDIRIVLSWDADSTDVDFEVTDPNDERVFFRHPRSYQGGWISRDVTGGYGPEEFILKNAKLGKYTVTARYYGNRQQIIAGDVTLQMRLQTHFGTADEKEEIVTMRLKKPRDTVVVGEFTVK